MIVLSWSVQAVNSQERVEELESEVASHLSRHPGLNESGVRAGRRFDEHDTETHERQKKSRIDAQIIDPVQLQRIKRAVPGTEPVGERECDGASDECHERVADGMQRRGNEKAQEPRNAVQRPT
ncbi:MAG TPA: hypothetical protein VK762_10165 [Polyangiaceae bacterium]|nr:hypothetical protein [Polyangiaceae bacterium]